MKITKIIKSVGSPLLVLLVMSCNNKSSVDAIQENESVVLEQELENTKADMFSLLLSQENPLMKIPEEYKLTSKIDQKLIDNDYEISRKRVQERIVLVKDGHITEEDFANDINGAFEKNAPFKTELGKKISRYYAKKFGAVTSAVAASEDFKTFKKARTISTKLKENE